jgi:asparagine synthase (glutamine-hydrolysing)
MLMFHTRHEAPNEYLVDDYKLADPLVYRSPYASQAVATLAATIPDWLKVKKGVRKHILIEAVRDLLPPEVLTREKMGFAFPMHEWLAGPLRDLLGTHLSTSRVPAFLNAKAVKTEKDRFLKSPETESFKAVWLLLMLSLWGNKNFS